MKIKDLTGERYGRLIVTDFLRIDVRQSGRKYPIFRCRCDCGNIVDVTGESLRAGNTRSCGCLQKEITGNAFRKHGDCKTRLYNIWKGMKKRCYNKNERCYKWYGGRGVTVCEEWNNNYLAFKDWSIKNGYNDSLTIDRIDSNECYKPSNCRWANMETQSRNRSGLHLVTIGGETKCLTEWADIIGINRKTLFNRLEKSKEALSCV